VNPLEVAAVAFGIVSVWLSTREHIASWPTAIVNVSLYFIVFGEAKLYADMGLQVFYFVLSWYGWYQWKFGGANRSELPVGRTARRHVGRLVPLGIAGSLALGLVLARTTDAALPWVDSATSVTSLLAQWMMTRKLLENWLVWIAVDVVYVAMFIFKELYLTAGLYAVFLLLAVKGYVDWRRSFAQAHAPPSPAASPA
jgi:nicotinamide mononucleotide transporter